MKKQISAVVLLTAITMSLAACGSSNDLDKIGEGLAEDLIEAYNDGDADAARELACSRFTSNAAKFANSNENGGTTAKITGSSAHEMDGDSRFTKDFTIDSDTEGVGTMTFKFGKNNAGDWCVRGLST